jgi:hypothetical protein
MRHHSGSVFKVRVSGIGGTAAFKEGRGIAGRWAE